MSDINDEKDTGFMKVALREAMKGKGLTSPNPAVGCIIVKGGKIISKGYHRSAGSPHAEVEAINKAPAKSLKGSTLYVTLEPCSTHGRTPPCADSIVNAGIKRVVYGSNDPNPVHRGKAKRLLKRKGIHVTGGILQKSCEKLIRPFSKYISTGLPWVVAKAGMSIDGRLTRPANEGQWLTNKESIADAQKIRAEVDAIIVGAGTVRADDPKLTIREPKILKRGKEQPWRVILTRSGNLSDKAKVFTDRLKNRTLLYEKKSLKAVLKDLARKYDCMNVMIEGGGKLLGEAFRKQLVDEVCFYIAPIICGTKCTPVADIAFPSSAQLSDTTVKRFGEDLRVRGLVRN